MIVGKMTPTDILFLRIIQEMHNSLVRKEAELEGLRHQLAKKDE